MLRASEKQPARSRRVADIGQNATVQAPTTIATREQSDSSGAVRGALNPGDRRVANPIMPDKAAPTIAFGG